MNFNDVYLLHSPQIETRVLERTVVEIREVLDVSVAVLEDQGGIPPLRDQDLLLTLVDDDRFKRLWLELAGQPVLLAPLSTGDNHSTCMAFALSSSQRKNLARITADDTPARCSLLTLNDEVVLEPVVIGKSPDFHNRSGWQRWRSALSYLRWMHMYPFRLHTAKGQKIELAALFVTIGDESAMAERHPGLFAGNRVRVAALAYAPKSMLSFFRLLGLKRWQGRGTGLPEGLGSIESRELEIEALRGETQVQVDGQQRRSSVLHFETRKTTCRVAMGRVQPCAEEETDKESIRVQGVPANSEEMDFFLKRHLPLLPVAAEKQFEELFRMLRKNAVFSSVFATLMVLASLLATLGLLQNSAPVIIGAMILAPLMAPIVSLSMGLLRFDRGLIVNSLKTLGMGVGLALGLAALFAWWLPFDHFTDEISARLDPTLLDLGVAIVSGIAAAYAYSREEIAKSLAGVAIAVALVPPLNVAGIGIGWGDPAVFQGAFLLFLTNLIGIVVAAGVSFYILGFASLRYARVAFLYKLGLLALISLPLLYSTQVLLDEDSVYRRFDNMPPVELGGYLLQLQLLEVRKGPQGPVALVRTRVPSELSRNDREQLMRELNERLQVDVELELAYFRAARSAE